MNNKKGVKLLAAVMVLAMAFAGIVVASEDSDAATPAPASATTLTNTNFVTGIAAGDYKLESDITITTDVEISNNVNIYGADHKIILKADIYIKGNVTVLFDGCIFENDSETVDKQIQLKQNDAEASKLVINNCSFTGTSAGAGNEDRTMFIADGSATITNTKFNDKKLTISYFADKVTIRNCSDVYLNFGVSATFDADSTSETAVVDIDSATSIYGIKAQDNTTIDLGETTIVAENFFVKTGIELENGTITADIVPYEDTVSPTVRVSDVTLLGNNKIDKVAITVEAYTEFTISGQVTIGNGGSITAQTGATFINNNDAPGSNALVANGDAKGDGWELVGTTLTLNGYNGSNIFKGTFTDVILIGDNTITLDADKDGIIAIESTALKNISTLATGEGSLSITISGEYAKQAIKTTLDIGNTLTINGVVIQIDISNEANTSALAYAIDSTPGTIDISFSDITIVMDDEDEAFCAFKGTTAVKIFRSSVDITVPAVGIETPDLKVAESAITVDAGKGAIKATASNISNQSKIDVKSVKGYAFEGAFTITQGSEIVASSMKISGTTENYATVTNNGNMVIDATAKFTNNASFVNNGTIGVYGTFINAEGETVNNGEINTYGYTAGSYGSTVAVTDGTKTETFKFSNVIALADGSFTIDVNVKDDVNTGSGKDISGTMTVTSNKIIIKAIDTDCSVTISLTFDNSNVKYYTVVVSNNSFNATDKNVTDETNNNSNKDALKNLAKLKATAPDQSIEISGGKVDNKGSIGINTELTTATEFVCGGELVNNGEIIANSAITMTSGKLSGNAISLGPGVAVTLNGDVNIAFDYVGEYTYLDDETEKDITVQFDNEISIIGDCVGAAFSTQAGSAINNAVFISTVNKAATDKTVKVTVVKGTLVAYGKTTVFKDDVTIDVLSGATFETKGTINVGSGVLAAQDGSILNIKGDDVESYTYGELVYTISFVKDGYTYYGDLVYALANATEGMKLTLTGTSTVIENDLVVGKGVTLEFAKKATLALGTTTKVITISMLEGASFVFTDENNKITVANKGATVSGTFTYDGNTVVLDKVLLDDGSDKIEAVKATKTDASRIAFTVTNALKDGKITSAAGIVSASATFGQDAVKKIASKLVVSEGTTVVSNTVALGTGSFVTVDGILALNNSATISATVDGTGVIALADTFGVTFDGTIAQNIAVTNKAGTDKVVLAGMIANYKDANPATDNKVVITSVKATGTKAAYLDISGKYYSGTIQVNGNAGLSALTVDTKAILDVPAGSTVTVVTESTVVGLVKIAGTINMRVSNDPATVSYATLKYDITYTDGDYTVYTIVETAVSNASAGDSFTLTKDLEVSDKLEVPSGVTIIVPEDYKIILGANEYIILGSGITTLGATGGIQGTVELSGNAYVIEFADASMDSSAMKIVSGETGKKIVDSQVTVLNQLYATAYAIENAATLANNVLKNVIPEIDGYRFVEFTSVVGGDVPEKVGDGDVIASMMASQVQVVFQKVDGITYYVNNVKHNTVGAPVYVNYGATVTAVADYGYSGTPLVNGKAYITVDNTTTTIVGSGVSPASAPETSSDSGMEITDYLLIVLVVLAAVLVVIVAIRMMRS